MGNRLAENASLKGLEVFSAYKEHIPQHGKPVRLDIADEGQVGKAVSEIRPHLIVNTAGLTDVDRCEIEPDLASLVNGESVRHIANAASEADSFLVQVSTDGVFDGEKGRYSETDPPHPINTYGLSKLEGERAAEALGEGSWCIARTSVLYGRGRPWRPNAATYVYEKLSKGERVFMVTDQYSNPTLNTNLAAMILEIAERRISGIIHTTGATRLSRYDFAIRLAKTLDCDERLITAAGANDMHWRAKRPRDSSLDVTRATRILSEKPLPIDTALEELRRELEKAKSSQSL